MTKTAVRERPILMSGPMVKALLEGRKTQTRRIVKPQPPDWIEEFGFSCFTPAGHISGRGRCNGELAEKFFRFPYGVPGDHLWVREAWAPYPDACGGAWYRAGVPVYYAGRKTGEWDTHDRLMGRPVPPDIRWRPSIFMPRWASRITLELTGVRGERLQDISYLDCLAEGMPPVPVMDDGAEPEAILAAIRGVFRETWDKLNTPRGHPWESNPFVWVLEFRRIEP